MASQIHYLLAREQQAALDRQTERVRQMRDGVPVNERSRCGSRLRRWLGGSEERKLPLAPRGVERAPVAAGCLEVE